MAGGVLLSMLPLPWHLVSPSTTTPGDGRIHWTVVISLADGRTHAFHGSTLAEAAARAWLATRTDT